MTRRIYVIADGTEIDDDVKAAAKAEECTEILDGVPPVLADELDGVALPAVYVELSPEPAEPGAEPTPEPIADVAERVDALASELGKATARVAELEAYVDLIGDAVKIKKPKK